MSTQKDKGSSLIEQPELTPTNPTEEPLTIEEIQRHTIIDVKKLVEINEKHPDMSIRDKAKVLNCSHPTILKVQEMLDIVQYRSKHFRDNRADILANLGQRILNEHLTDERIKKLEPRTAVTWYGVLADKEHKERQVNQAPRTFHISVKEVHIGIKQGELSPDDPFNVKAIKDMTGPLIEVAQEAIEDKQVPPTGEDSTSDNEEIIPEGSKPLKDKDKL